MGKKEDGGKEGGQREGRRTDWKEGGRREGWGTDEKDGGKEGGRRTDGKDGGDNHGSDFRPAASDQMYQVQSSRTSHNSESMQLDDQSKHPRVVSVPVSPMDRS